MAIILGLFTLMTIYLLIKLLFNPEVSSIVLLLMFGTVVLFLVVIAASNAFKTILRGIAQFLFLTPTYVNIFLIYAICNIHDCTWGNRPDQLSKE